MQGIIRIIVGARDGAREPSAHVAGVGLGSLPGFLRQLGLLLLSIELRLSSLLPSLKRLARRRHRCLSLLLELLIDSCRGRERGAQLLRHHLGRLLGLTQRRLDLLIRLLRAIWRARALDEHAARHAAPRTQCRRGRLPIAHGRGQHAGQLGRRGPALRGTR